VHGKAADGYESFRGIDVGYKSGADDLQVCKYGLMRLFEPEDGVVQVYNMLVLIVRWNASLYILQSFCIATDMSSLNSRSRFAIGKHKQVLRREFFREETPEFLSGDRDRCVHRSCPVLLWLIECL
jgi:hypothetical protein